MELFDVLDIHGNPTGITARRGTGVILQEGQHYLGINAYIYNTKFEFLIQQRSYNKDFAPGRWDIHAGHVIACESSEEGMIREVKEEIGLDIEPNNICAVKRVFYRESPLIVDIFFINKEYELDKIVFKKDEVIAVKTISGKEMIDMVRNSDFRPDEYRDIVIKELKNIVPVM